MRKIVIIPLMLLISLAAGAQKSPKDGTWSGKLNVMGTELTLIFHLNNGACTMDSPDQGVTGLPATLEHGETGIKISIPTINARFEGNYRVASIVGTFTQHGKSFPMTLTPGSSKRSRPQTPVAPFPYQTEEVSFSNGDALLKGTLTTPKDYTRQTPVLLMVTGSGLQNRDEEIFEHKPFAVIADALARQGIATLRYDDRGFCESTGDVISVTTADLKNDALAGINLLRSRFDRVGIIGHSEGGTIGLMLAAEGKTDFVVSLAGNIVSGEKTLLEQNQYVLQQAGYSQDVVDQYCKTLESIFDSLKVGKNPIFNITTLPADLAQNLQMVKVQSATPYMRYFLNLDITNLIGNIRCPVLALNGTKDRQVNCEENLSILRRELKGRKSILAIEGVNHLFQHCTTGDPSEYKEIEETFAPEVIHLIIEWLKQL